MAAMAAILDFFRPIFELVRDFGVTNTCTKFEENLQTRSKVRALTRRVAGAGGSGARDSIISSDYCRGYNNRSFIVYKEIRFTYQKICY